MMEPAIGEVRRAETAGRIRSLFLHRWFIPAIALLGMILTLPSLSVGWIADDFYHRWIILGSPHFTEVGRRPLDMFTFFDGDPVRTQRMKEIGLIPWWTYPKIRAAFWKPLTALTHILDYQLWPTHPGLMHAQNIFWFGVLVLCAGYLYRQFMGATVAAGLATLLYAVDYSRAIPTAWIANRNSVLAGIFGVLCVWAHRRWRTNATVMNAIPPAIFLGMSLLCAEAGLAAAAYVAAYQLALDRGNIRRRLAGLLPALLVIAAWRIVWSWRGYGVAGVARMYSDPMSGPVHFLGLILIRAPILLLGQFLAPPADLNMAISAGGVAFMCIGGVVVVAALTFFLLPLLRRSGVARFWGVGMLLATVPIAAAAPANRHLVFIGIGAMGLLGQLFSVALTPRYWQGFSGVGRIWMRAAIGLLVVVHLILSPVVLVAMSRYPWGPSAVVSDFLSIPNITPADRGRDLIIVNHPLPAYLMPMLTKWAADRTPVPRSTQILSPADSDLRISRPDANSLDVRSQAGYFGKLSSGFLYSADHPMPLGKTMRIAGMEITILAETADGRPTEVLFHFKAPLEDSSLHWVAWRGGRFGDFLPPAIGEEVKLGDAGLPF